MSGFTHLHIHTEYSLLDGLTTPEELAKVVVDNQQTACAITDHGTMAGALRFQKAARSHGINPIFGCEFYYVPSLAGDNMDKATERYHLILLAKNDEGLKKLFRLQRQSWTKGFYYKPRIEFADLDYLRGDVVCLSGCMGGYISQKILLGQTDKAEAAVDRFSEIFAKDYYIEVQPWNPDILNKNLIEIADAKNIELVGTIDSHYPTCNERGVEEVLLAIGQQGSMNAAQKRHLADHSKEAASVHDLVAKIDILFPDRRLYFKEHDMHVQSTDEVRQYFSNVGITRNAVIDNTMVIADKCHSEIKTGQSLLPKYSKTLDSNEYLEQLVQDGLEVRGLHNEERYVERMQHELGVIQRLDFADYFLSIWDIVAWARRNKIAVGHSRGSVGGSLTAYLLGITSIDPIKFNLLFARFINEERNDYPDIDLDFEDARRSEVKEYVKEKWGSENVASITTFGEYKPKSTIKDVARVFGVPFNTMNDLTSKFETIEDLETAKWARDFRAEQPDIVPTAKSLVGRIRNAGAHAAGVVISNRPLYEVLPIESRNDTSSDGRIEVTAFDMDQCAEVGLIKIDVLGVRAVTVVKDALEKVKENYGIDVTELSLGLDDPKVYEAFNEGYLTGIFQAEASAYRHLVSDMGIDNFDDLVASNALVRPGALITQGASYIARKKGKEDVDYLHEILIPILKDTYGKFLYQEQLMQAAVDLAGFSWAEADNLRKIIGKKKDVAEFDKYRDQFIDGASRYISRPDAAAMWQDFEKSSLYMFNKSHAVGYSMLSYQTMWLKCHYPLEFIWASLYNENNKADITGFLMEAKRLQIPVLPPDVSYSGERFTLHDGAIRFGLMNVSHCGPNGASNIIAQRPYRNYDEFIAKTSSRAVTTRLIENLDKVGAFESIGHISQYDHENYYLPILSYALGDDKDDEFADLYSECAEAESKGGWNIVKGLVKSTSKKPTFFRVEIEDQSGMVYGFCQDRTASISARDYVIAMFHDQTLVTYCDATSATDNYDNKFLQFMRKHLLAKQWYEFTPQVKDGTGVIAVVLEPRIIKAKSGYEFATVNYWDGEEIRNAKIEVDLFKAQRERLEQFNTVILKLQTGQRGAKIIDVRLLAEYAKMKKLDVQSII